MEKLSLLLDKSTVEMLHLLARKSGKTIGTMVQEMALERYMNHALGTSDTSEAPLETAIGQKRMSLPG